MLPADILNLARLQPFVPFRLYLADGRTLEVRHPDMILVGVGSVTVGTPDPAAFIRACSTWTSCRSPASNPCPKPRLPLAVPLEFLTASKEAWIEATHDATLSCP
jgi:hypothetical protein